MSRMRPCHFVMAGEVTYAIAFDSEGERDAALRGVGISLEPLRPLRRAPAPPSVPAAVEAPAPAGRKRKFDDAIARAVAAMGGIGSEPLKSASHRSRGRLIARKMAALNPLEPGPDPQTITRYLDRHCIKTLHQNSVSKPGRATTAPKRRQNVGETHD